MRRRTRTLLALAAAALCGACGREPQDVAPAPQAARDPDDVAKRGVHEQFKLSQRTPRSPADGAGRARLLPPPASDATATVGTPGRWGIEYTAGPLGIAVGGALYLQMPFWGWSPPQAEGENEPGFTKVSTSANGVALTALTLEQLLCVKVGGRPLREGETIVLEYGAGEVGALADSYAERASRFWLAVDGDGDDVRAVLADSPTIDVLPGPPAMLVATLTSTAKPGAPVALNVALLDARANRCGPCEATLEVVDAPPSLHVPATIGLVPADRGCKRIALVAGDEGVQRVALRAKLGERTLEATTNPLLVAASGPRVLWGDLHGHSGVSDGTGTPEDWFEYARDVAALDVAALTDHDHWGMLFLDEHPEMWAHNVEVARRFDAPGAFVALPGYEWTSWLTGHRHVLFFGDATPLCSSMDERYESPQQLREALRGADALIVPHHPAGGPIAIDWRIAPDAGLEPVVEVCSAHGSSEGVDCPRPIYDAHPGHFARDELERGARLGFVASGDGHDGHAGLAAKGPHYPTGGLVAFLAEDLTHAGLRDALKARRCYATSGPRILLRFALAGARMGEVVAAAKVAEDAPLYVQVIGTDALESVEVLVKGERALTMPCRGETEFASTVAVGALKHGDFVYVRVVQRDGGMAWSSPVFVE